MALGVLVTGRIDGGRVRIGDSLATDSGLVVLGIDLTGTEVSGIRDGVDHSDVVVAVVVSRRRH